MKIKTLKARRRNYPVYTLWVMSIGYLILTIWYLLDGNRFDIPTIMSIGLLGFSLLFIRRFEINLFDDKLQILRKSVIKRLDIKYDFHFNEIERIELKVGKKLPLLLYSFYNNRWTDELIVYYKSGKRVDVDLKGNVEKIKNLVDQANSKIEKKTAYNSKHKI